MSDGLNRPKFWAIVKPGKDGGVEVIERSGAVPELSAAQLEPLFLWLDKRLDRKAKLAQTQRAYAISL
jgi:hypothetical protein